LLLATYLTCLINKDRAKLSLAPFSINAGTLESSVKHAIGMADYEFLDSKGSDSSTGSQHLTQNGVDWTAYKGAVTYRYPEKKVYASLKSKTVYRDMFFSK
jgi:uncharacterized protein YkwD